LRRKRSIRRLMRQEDGWRTCRQPNRRIALALSKKIEPLVQRFGVYVLGQPVYVHAFGLK
jgi:hypothetical protein